MVKKFENKKPAGLFDTQKARLFDFQGVVPHIFSYPHMRLTSCATNGYVNITILIHVTSHHLKKLYNIFHWKNPATFNQVRNKRWKVDRHFFFPDLIFRLIHKKDMAMMYFFSPIRIVEYYSSKNLFFFFSFFFFILIFFFLGGWILL